LNGLSGEGEDMRRETRDQNEVSQRLDGKIRRERRTEDERIKGSFGERRREGNDLVEIGLGSGSAAR